MLGDNILIENTHNYIANYRIKDNCYIENVNVMVVEGESSFGNNVQVSVLNETGGREVPIYNQLSAPIGLCNRTLPPPPETDRTVTGNDCRLYPKDYFRFTG